MKKPEIKTPLSPKSIALPIPEITKPETSIAPAQEVPYVGSPIEALESEIISSLTNSATLTTETLSNSTSRPTSPEIEPLTEGIDDALGVFLMEL
jgi:hypothetical protein